MIEESGIKEIKNVIDLLLEKMAIRDFKIELQSPDELSPASLDGLLAAEEKNKEFQKDKVNVIDLNITLKEPQTLIGRNGQTLINLQHLLRAIINKKLKKTVYFRVDINNYKKKKINYLKNLAREAAKEVSLTKKKKILFPMSAYERRIIYMELTQRQDVIAEGQGSGDNRRIVINPAE